MTNREYATPFSVLHAASLLSHRGRLRKFKEAIEGVVRPDDYVIDIGTGTGVLAIIAAKAGARVTAIDINKESLVYAQKAAQLNGVQDRIDFVNSHYSVFIPTELADVVICEMLSSLMLIEQQIPASTYAVSRLLKPTGHIIPERVNLFVVPVENETQWIRFNVEDLTFPRVIQTTDRIESRDLANLIELVSFNLTELNPDAFVDRILQFEIVENGTLHGLCGMFDCILNRQITLQMEDGWREVFLPLEESHEVKAGDSIRLHLRFRPGEYDSLLLKIL
ncbi:MAG: 50S ribosomal protein L11 methyltransferase [Candidatus Thorarchaeota archaeon]|nr:50S ribosomal protein L11 methyltransferase [Candidatus Thorarchaeota archaeon]